MARATPFQTGPHLAPDPAGPQTIELGGGRHLKLLDVVGQGSSGTVHRALLCSSPLGYGGDEEIERIVAVKVFSWIASEESEQVLATLVRNVRRMVCVDHPNVAEVFDCGIWRGRPFLVSELVSGISLNVFQESHAATKRRVPLDLALFIGSEVAEALAGARGARDYSGLQLGILHQSLSAREVLLSWRGVVKVTDFGTSAARVASSSIRSLRGVAGRVSAMAPEVAQGELGDARSDVFSLGILLRELLIGPRFPVSLTNAEAIRLARDGYVSPVTFQPHLPDGLSAVLHRALEVDPEKRYPNACVMAAELRREAFAMGVGDGRYFLRRALERDWGQCSDEITAERSFPSHGATSDGQTLPPPRRNSGLVRRESGVARTAGLDEARDESARAHPEAGRPNRRT